MEPNLVAHSVRQYSFSIGSTLTTVDIALAVDSTLEISSSPCTLGCILLLPSMKCSMGTCGCYLQCVADLRALQASSPPR